MPLLYSKELAVILASYALGCVCTGYYLVRYRTGQDIRGRGSASVGSRNVGRMLGAPGLIVTLLGDTAKGALATWAAFALDLASWGVLLAMVAVVAGHIWPVQLGFRGGKGLAPVLGAMLVFDYQLVAILGLVAIIALVLARQLTLAVLVAVALAPGVALLTGEPPASALGIAALALIILFAHRANIRGSLRGPGTGGTRPPLKRRLSHLWGTVRTRQ